MMHWVQVTLLKIVFLEGLKPTLDLEYDVLSLRKLNWFICLVT